MSGTLVKKGAKVCYSIVDSNVVIEEGSLIGQPKESGNGIALLGRNITVSGTVAGGQIIDKDQKGE